MRAISQLNGVFVRQDQPLVDQGRQVKADPLSPPYQPQLTKPKQFNQSHKSE